MRINHRVKHLNFIASNFDTAGHAIDADVCIDGITEAQRSALVGIARRCKDIARALRELSSTLDVDQRDGGAA